MVILIKTEHLQNLMNETGIGNQEVVYRKGCYFYIKIYI